MLEDDFAARAKILIRLFQAEHLVPFARPYKNIQSKNYVIKGRNTAEMISLKIYGWSLVTNDKCSLSGREKKELNVLNELLRKGGVF